MKRWAWRIWRAVLYSLAVFLFALTLFMTGWDMAKDHYTSKEHCECR